MKLADNLSRHKISCVQNLARVDYLELTALIAEKTLFDFLGRLDLG